MNKGYNVVSISTETIGRFDIIKEIVSTCGGNSSVLLCEDKNCVATLCIFGGHIVLLNQCRHKFDTWELEIPAGSVDQVEDPKLATIREVEEETGLRPKNVDYLGYFYLSSGSTTERFLLYYADQFDKTERQLEELEMI